MKSPPKPMGKYEKPQRNDVNSTEGSDILVFNCYLCHVRFLLTCYVCSTKIGEISDISKCFENFVPQALGVLTRIYAAELRYEKNSISKTWRKPVEQGKQIYRLGKC